MTTAQSRLLALLGDPVSHSRSPALMTHALAAMGEDACYLAMRVTAEKLPDALLGLAALGALGANVTVPHKSAVLGCGVRPDAASEAVGAVNTLRFGPQGIEGFNTDAPGAVRALRDAGVELDGAEVVVLGAGGAARAVVAGVAAARALRVHVVARDKERAEAVARVAPQAARGCATHAIRWEDESAVLAAHARARVAVHCTTLGMLGGPVGLAPARWLDALPADAAVMDIVYSPRETLWLSAARARGLRAVDGLGMLAWQAALSLELWFGRPVDGAALATLLSRG